MPYQSPARWIAPLSLLAVTVATLSILSAGGDEGSRTAEPARLERSGTATATTASTTRRSRPRSTYTVKSGDVLSSIASQTGVSIERLQELNPGLDAQALRIGQRLKLRP